MILYMYNILQTYCSNNVVYKKSAISSSGLIF